MKSSVVENRLVWLYLLQEMVNAVQLWNAVTRCAAVNFSCLRAETERYDHLIAF